MKNLEEWNFLFSKLKFIASNAILIGAVLLLAKVDETFNLYNVPYILIIGGLILLVISLLATNKEKSLLCRVGLHKFEQVGRDSEFPALFIYKCERCRKESLEGYLTDCFMSNEVTSIFLVHFVGRLMILM